MSDHNNNISTEKILSEEELEEVSLFRNFRERSELSQEIISRRPDFIERWALLIFLVLLLMVVAGSWFIRYPDTVEGRAFITVHNAPKELIAPRDGRLIALFKKNNQSVNAGEMIGWLETTASTQEVMQLSAKVNNAISLISQGRSAEVPELFNHRLINLGELEASYQVFNDTWQQYNDYMVNGFYAKRKQLLNNDITALQQQKETMQEQQQLLKNDNDLAIKSFEMNEKLYKEKIISLEEYRNAKSALINKQMSIPQINAGIISQQNQIRDKQKEIDQLNHDFIQQEKIFDQALHTLKSQVDEWMQHYTIRAPVSGQIAFVLPVQQNQYLQAGRLLGYINTPDMHPYAEVRLSQQSFGKIDTGMQVHLRLDAYPYNEMGFVAGKLDYISAVSVDSGFLATVRLDNGLATNMNKKLPYKNGLKAQAVIITKDMRLLERLYYNIVKTSSLNK